MTDSLTHQQNRTIFIGKIYLLTLQSSKLKMIPKILKITFKSAFVYNDLQYNTNLNSNLKNNINNKDDIISNPQGKISLTNKNIQFIEYNDPAYNAYLNQLSIINQCKDIRSLIFLLNSSQQSMEVIGASSQSQGKRLYQSIKKYHIINQYFQQNKKFNIPFNPLLMQNLMNCHQNQFTIDPEDFNQSSQQKQILIYQTFLDQATQIQVLNLHYKNTDQTSLKYTNNFLEKCQNKILILKLTGVQLFQTMLKSIIKPDIFGKLHSLILKQNYLTDNCFPILTQLLKRKKSSNLYMFDLSKNQITFKHSNHEDILNFFQNAQRYIDINLSQNKISDPQFINKYIIFAQQVPLDKLNISNNLIIQDQLVNIVVQYSKRKHKFQLICGELGLIHPICFQYLSKQANKNDINITLKLTKGKININSKQKQNNALNQLNDLSISKNQSIQEKRNSQRKSQQETQKQIQRLHYAYQYGDFRQISILIDSLLQQGAKFDNSELQAQRKQKKLQQTIILRQMYQISSMDIDEWRTNEKLDDFLRKAHRKGISGQPIDYLIYLKYKRDLIIQQYLRQKINPQNQLFIKFISNYQLYLQSASIDNNSFINKNINYWNLAQKSDEKLIQETIKNNAQNIYHQYQRLSFILNSDLGKLKSNHIQLCRLQLKLSSSKIVHNFQKRSIKQFLIRKLFGNKVLRVQIQNKLEFLSTYQIYNYSFELSARRAGFEGYQGILCTYNYKPFQNQFLAFTQIVVSFLKYLYFDPNKIMSQTIQYLQFIVNQIKNSANPIIYAQQFYLHIFTFNTKIKLAKGILKKVFQYLTACIQNSPQIQPYIVAHLIKYQATPIQQIRLHFLDIHENAIPKINWNYRGKQLQNLIQQDGMIVFNFKNTQEKVKKIWVHHLTSIGELVKHNKQFKRLFNEWVSRENSINDYWFFNLKSLNTLGYEQVIPYYETVGKLMSQQCQIIFRRVFFDDKCLNKKKLQGSSKQDINELYNEIKYCFLYSNQFTKNDNTTKLITKLITSQMLISGHNLQMYPDYIKSIQKYMPINTLYKKPIRQIMQQQKLEIVQSLRRRFRNQHQNQNQNQNQNINQYNITQKQAQVQFIWDITTKYQKCQNVSICYFTKDINIRVFISFRYIIIQEITNFNEQPILLVKIPWTHFIGVQFQINNQILKLHYSDNLQPIKLNLFQIKKTSKISQSHQQQWILNIYLAIYGYALKRLQSDYSTLYFSANKGFCQCQPSQQQISLKMRQSVFLHLSQFIIQNKKAIVNTSLSQKRNIFLEKWFNNEKNQRKKSGAQTQRRSSRQRLPKKRDSSKQSNNHSNNQIKNIEQKKPNQEDFSQKKNQQAQLNNKIVGQQSKNTKDNIEDNKKEIIQKIEQKKVEQKIQYQKQEVQQQLIKENNSNFIIQQKQQQSNLNQKNQIMEQKLNEQKDYQKIEDIIKQNQRKSGNSRRSLPRRTSRD